MTPTRAAQSEPRRIVRELLRKIDRAPVDRQAALQAAVARAAEKAGVSVEALREYAMGPRQYDSNGLSGCVTQRRSRLTGTLAGLYSAVQSGMDPEAGPWVTVCEAHATCVNHATLATARAHLADPSTWCDACRDATK